MIGSQCKTLIYYGPSAQMESVVLAALCAVSVALSHTELLNLESFLQSSDYQLRRKYRPRYHVSAPSGWLGDPAGFIYFKNKYHLFYQYYPHDGATGPLHWGHVVSEDLVEWTHYPDALTPSKRYDRHGCLGGSVVIYNGFLTLFFTGEALAANLTHHTQNLAVSSDSIIFHKYRRNPVIRTEPSMARDFRNPKVWRFQTKWFMIVGSSIAGRGQLLLYSSPDLYRWRLKATIAKSFGDLGYLWECPDVFEVDGQSVLVLSLRGVQPIGNRFRNLQQTGYVIGHLNFRSVQFEDLEISAATFAEFDHGHDFYSVKVTRSADGRVLMVAGLGLWQSEFLEADEGWAGSMTLVREVHMGEFGRLVTPPARELLSLRNEVLENAWYYPGEAFYAGTRTFELVINATSTSYDVVLSLEWNSKQRYTVSYSAKRRYVSVDRRGVDGERRSDWVAPATLHWRMFVDRNSVELFVGDGEVVFTSRIYPYRDLCIRIGGDIQLHLTQYRLGRTIGYDSKVKTYLKEQVLSKRL